jgi:2-oxo-4-hydroxy-4-carboxy-5-ureidoimidazoline decarboxylase
MAVSFDHLNKCDAAEFLRICGPFFEHSPWIAERTATKRPFASRQALHEALCDTVLSSSLSERVGLIEAHPDLVGKLARRGKLTSESTAEQAAAGLTRLSDSEIALFEVYNASYRDKFGFPFVICARQNKKDAILQAFPRRLANDREQEIQTALQEIFKIALLRMTDVVLET